MSKRNEFDLAKIEQAAALLKQAGYHVYPDQRVLTVECCHDHLDDTDDIPAGMSPWGPHFDAS